MTRIGTIGNYSAFELADRAAQRIVGTRKPRALCIDPAGVVTLGPPDDAVPTELVGVYGPDGGLAATYRRIRDDLEHELEGRT